MAEKKCGYAGKITHAGTQKVTAPFTDETKRGKGKVVRGDDLRANKN